MGGGKRGLGVSVKLLMPKASQSILRARWEVQKILEGGHCTEVRFSSFFSGGFITVIVVNPPERKLAKRTSVH